MMKKPQMTPRERVMASAKGLPVDRVPVMFWLNPHAAAKLIAEYQPAKNKFYRWWGRRVWKNFRQGHWLFSEETCNALPLTLQVYANSEYVCELGADMANIPFGSATFWGRLYREKGRLRARDAFGSVRGMGGIYLEVIEPSIKEIKDLAGFQFPDASADKHYERIRRFRKRHPGLCIFVDNFGVQDLPATQVWEMSKFMMAMVDYPDEVKAFQKRWADYMIGIARKSAEAGADIIFIYDDYGYTDQTLLSMKMWKEFTYPQLRRQVDAAHDAGALVMLHSCGFQTPFLDYYVEAGVDILQSFQPKAGNDFQAAFEKYGNRLCFATGIDVQQCDNKTREQVRAEIIANYKIGKSTGRHILGMTHMLQHVTPLPVMKAIFGAVRAVQDSKVE